MTDPPVRRSWTDLDRVSRWFLLLVITVGGNLRNLNWTRAAFPSDFWCFLGPIKLRQVKSGGDCESGKPPLDPPDIDDKITAPPLPQNGPPPPNCANTSSAMHDCTFAARRRIPLFDCPTDRTFVSLPQLRHRQLTRKRGVCVNHPSSCTFPFASFRPSVRLVFCLPRLASCTHASATNVSRNDDHRRRDQG